MSKIVVVGGGAAGLLCAAKSAEKGNDVIIIEKMNRCGRKLMITGKGRCNVTNASFELDDLISNVPTNPRFLYSAFSNFMPYDTMALFEELGVPLKIERGNRVFPQSDKAVDIVDALVNYAKQSGVKIIQGKVKAFELDGNAIKTLILDDKTKIECDKVCLCTGGKSYPLTGSTGDGYTLASHECLVRCLFLQLSRLLQNILQKIKTFFLKDQIFFPRILLIVAAHDRGDGFQLGFCKLRRNHFCNLLRCVRLHEVHSLLQCLREFFYGCAVRFQITLFDAVRRIRHIPGFRSDRCHDIAVALLLEQCRGRFKFNRIIPLPAIATSIIC